MFNKLNSRKQMMNVTNVLTTNVRSFNLALKKANTTGIQVHGVQFLLREGLFIESEKQFMEKNDDRIYIPCDRHSKDWRKYKEAA